MWLLVVMTDKLYKLYYKNQIFMKKSELYNNFLLKIKENLEKDNFESLDYILEFIYTSWLSQKDIAEMDEILNEATLYLELKDGEYKEKALELIGCFSK